MLPPLAGVALFIAGVWFLLAFIIAVRQVLEYQTTIRAVGVSALAWGAEPAIIYLLLPISLLVTHGQVSSRCPCPPLASETPFITLGAGASPSHRVAELSPPDPSSAPGLQVGSKPSA